MLWDSDLNKIGESIKEDDIMETVATIERRRRIL